MQGLYGFGQRGGGLFEGDDIGVAAQRLAGGGRKIHTGAGGDIVKHQRLIDRIGDGGIAFDQPLLRGFVVIWRHHQKRVRTRVACVFAHFYGVVGIVGAGACDDGNAAGRALDRMAYQPLVLRVCEGCIFARGAAHGNGGNPGGNLAF